MRITPEITTTPMATAATGKDNAARLSQATTAGGEAASSGSASQTTLGASAVGLTAQAMAEPEVRQQRVEQLRAQIAAGTYEPPAEAVADAMAEDPMTGLGGKGTA